MGIWRRAGRRSTRGIGVLCGLWGVLVWRLVKDLGGNVLFTELLVVFRPAPSRLQRLDVLREVVFAIEVCREAGSCCH
jgi:hypothetical protein